MALQVTEVQKALKGADYPAKPEDLARVAERNGAPDELVQALRGIDGEVDGPDAVMHRIKGKVDLGGSSGR